MKTRNTGGMERNAVATTVATVVKTKGKGAFREPFMDSLMRMVFLVAASLSILCVALICVFLFANGIPAIGKIGPLRFFAGTQWRPGSGLYGIAPMILGSLYVTAGAIVAGVPLGILCAVFMARFCPARLHKTSVVRHFKM